MTFDILKTDWTTARTKLAAWKASERSADIFAGRSTLARRDIDGVSVLKITVQPLDKQGKLAPVSNSYALDPAAKDLKWSALSTLTEALPFNLSWLQADEARFDLHFDLPEAVRCLGLGERFSNLNLRGNTHTLFTTDNPNHNEHADMLYKAIPFLILEDGDRYVGLWLDSPAPQRWDLDTELTGCARVELFTRLGFNLYIFAETTLAALVGAFTALTGRAPLPPLWALGHQQCRWSYPDEATIRDLAREFRSRKIPCDTLVLDIDYMDEYRVFTNSEERFPSFAQLADEMDRDNFKLVTIVDPGVKKDEKFAVYRQGVAEGHFCKTAKGEVFIETVWPGLSAFPDFLQAKTRKWWGEKLKFYSDRGIAGIWNDMNEPAMFNSQKPLPVPLTNLPAENAQLMLQNGENGPVGHFEVRNLYGSLMSQATREALLDHRPDERPFVLTRSAGAGIQRHAAVWLGDNISWYEHLQKSLPMLINIGLSGVPFAGVDIGGFGGDTTPELLIRWYEIGIFYPFFRNHCAMLGRAQEPFSFSPRVEGMVRRLIEARYRLLPYLQGLFYEHMQTGAPIMRPLAWHFAGDERARHCDDQFMFGSEVMVAPVVQSNQRRREVYFPEGLWYQFDFVAGKMVGDLPYSGAQRHSIACPLGVIPAFVREGSILALADVMQSTVDYPDADITFYCFGERASGAYFEDDGSSLEYSHGRFGHWRISYADGKLTSDNLKPTNGFGPLADARKYFCIPVRSGEELVKTAVELMS